jgi:hypothetical protein
LVLGDMLRCVCLKMMGWDMGGRVLGRVCAWFVVRETREGLDGGGEETRGRYGGVWIRKEVIYFLKVWIMNISCVS